MSTLTTASRIAIATTASAVLAFSLTGCTLITTLASGGPTPTTTSTQSEKPTEKPTESTKPTTSSPKPTTSSPKPTASGTTYEDNVAELETWLAGEYEKEWGATATIDCPGTTLTVYEGLEFSCTAKETGGKTYTLTMTVSSVTSTGYSVKMRRS